MHDQWTKLWSIETTNLQPRISTDSNENQSNGKIRINDIKCEIYLLTFSSDKWPLKWAQLFSVAGHTSPAGVCKRVEALQVSHDFKTIFAISSERKITMTRNIYPKLDNILGYYWQKFQLHKSRPFWNTSIWIQSCQGWRFLRIRHTL